MTTLRFAGSASDPLPLPYTAWGAWFESPANLAHLYRWLRERGQEPEDVAYYMEKAWKWQAEWDDMVAHGGGPL